MKTNVPNRNDGEAISEEITHEQVFSSLDELISTAYKYLESHLVQGSRWGMPFYFYKPANTKYGAYQWLWDSAFHMMIWSHRNPDNAIRDLRTMLQMQQPDGFIPEIIFWTEKRPIERFFDKYFGYSNEKYTDISQMPMLGYALREIYRATGDKNLLKEFVPKLIKYMEWWKNTRDPDKDGLISIIHGWESGLDASPLYDRPYGVDNPGFLSLYPKFLFLNRIYKKKANWDITKILKENWFNVEDVGVNAIYADNWNVLGELVDEIDSSLGAKCRKQAQYFSDALIQKCWDDERGMFVSYYRTKKGEFKIIKETIQSLFPLQLIDLDKDVKNILVKKLKDPACFGTPYPVPTTAVHEPEFDPNDSRLMWRGPTWPNTNVFIVEGLLKQGEKEMASEIIDKWIDMHMNNGIFEYHNPLTGTPEGQEGLGMANSLVHILYSTGRVNSSGI